MKNECPKCKRFFPNKGISQHLKFCRGKKYCKKCGIEIHPDRIFCSLSCSNSFNKKKNKKKFCLYCSKEISSNTKYCNNTCYASYNRKIKIEKWLNGELDGNSKTGHASYVKHYLLEKYNNKCSKCKWGEINPFTKTIPLEVDHIDGHSYHNSPDNVTLFCPNCHSLTKTYRGANRGNGRKTYLKTYYMKDNNGKII